MVAVAAPLYAFWLIARICVVGSAWGERPERQSLDQFQHYWTPKRWLFASASGAFLLGSLTVLAVRNANGKRA